jgi:hypothetical protein
MYMEVGFVLPSEDQAYSMGHSLLLTYKRRPPLLISLNHQGRVDTRNTM